MNRDRLVVVAAVREGRRRRRIGDALADYDVRFADPDDWLTGDAEANADVALLDGAAYGGRAPVDGAAPIGAVTVTTPGTSGIRSRRLRTPVSAAALREAVDGASRRLAYADGLDRLAARATHDARADRSSASVDRSPARADPSPASADRLDGRLDALVSEFDHDDFVDAFHVAVKGA